MWTFQNNVPLLRKFFQNTGNSKIFFGIPGILRTVTCKCALVARRPSDRFPYREISIHQPLYTGCIVILPAGRRLPSKIILSIRGFARVLRADMINDDLVVLHDPSERLYPLSLTSCHTLNSTPLVTHATRMNIRRQICI